MLSFIFLNNIFRTRTDKSPCLPPSASSIDRILLWKCEEPPEAHDTSYVDALCDAHTRSLVRAEFAGVEPSAPADIYKRVLLAIDETAAPRVVRPALKPTFSFSAFFERLYRTVSGPATARVVPSGVALLLALSILTPSLSRMLTGESANQQPSSIETTSPALVSGDTSGGGLIHNVDNLIGPVTSPSPVLDPPVPAEDPQVDESRMSRGLRPLKQALRAQAAQDHYEYINQWFAPR
jgi:hypothetical protein